MEDPIESMAQERHGKDYQLNCDEKACKNGSRSGKLTPNQISILLVNGKIENH